jgi:ATP-dependent RNA helicase DDX6/DHH1
VIVATPGRILDLMRKNLADMSKCQMLVMDEVSIEFELLYVMEKHQPCDKKMDVEMKLL